MDLEACYDAPAAAMHLEEEGEADGMLFVEKLAENGVLMNFKVPSLGLGNADAPSSLEMSLSDHEMMEVKPGNGIAPTDNAELDKAEKGSIGTSTAPTCPECGKSFPSDKALYGHLRCHPEKGYKGVSRPAATGAVVADKKPKKQQRKTVLSSSWSVTAKRRRVSPKANAGSPRPWPAPEAPWLSPEEEAAWILVEMSTGHRRPEASGQPRQPEHVGGGGGGSSNGAHEEPKTSSAKPARDTETSGTKKRKKRLEELEPPPPANEAITTRSVRIPSPASARRYECTTCHKTFPTHQALGGHRASHNKGKYGTQDELALAHAMHNSLVHHHGMIRDQTAEYRHVVGAGEYHVNPLMPRAASTSLKHICSKCDMRFPTGQALGGHKRRHWPGPAERSVDVIVPSPVRVLPVSPPRAAGGGLWDIDLNELPKCEEKEP